jgi:ArsR family transcriptional regulator
MNDGVKLFNALGDEVRLKIVLALKDNERCACAIPVLVDRAQPTVSQHLKILREAGLITVRRDGREKMCSVSDPTIFKIIDFSKKITPGK